MRVIFYTLALAAMSLTGCSSSPEKSPLVEKVGQNCTVQFRRGDALGGGSNLPVSPTTSNINGADVSVNGKLKAVSGGWICLETAKGEYCIPHESILLLEFSK